MQIFIFKSETKPDLRAFGGDLVGSQLPESVQTLACDRRHRAGPGIAV